MRVTLCGRLADRVLVVANGTTTSVASPRAWLLMMPGLPRMWAVNKNAVIPQTAVGMFAT
jgi:hypothetical protein